MKKVYILSLLLCSLVITSQTIKRKAPLGVALYPSITDSLLNALKLKSKTGALIKTVIPNSTAETLGLKPFDVVTECNGKTILSRNDLIAQARQFRAEDEVTLSVLRGSKLLKLNTKAVPRAYEQHPNMTIIYGEFAYSKGFIRTIYRKPKDKTPLATVYFVQGISCYSLDNMQANDPTRLAIESIVNKGFAVYCVEKSGVGDSYNTTPCEETDYKLELDVYKEGYKHLLKQKDIDPKQIFVFGHSLGGVSAPLLAQEFEPKGVVVYGTALKPWSEYLQDVYITQQHIMGKDLALLRENFEAVKPAYYDLFYNKLSIEELVNDSLHLNAAKKILEYNTETKLCAANRTLQFHKDLNAYNLAMAWKNTKSYVMAIYGEADIAAIHPDDHVAIANYVNETHPGKGTYLFVPKTNHTFQEVGTMAEFVKMQSDLLAYEKMAAQHFNFKLFDEVCNWMKDKLTKTI